VKGNLRILEDSEKRRTDATGEVLEDCMSQHVEDGDHMFKAHRANHSGKMVNSECGSTATLSRLLNVDQDASRVFGLPMNVTDERMYEKTGDVILFAPDCDDAAAAGTDKQNPIQSLRDIKGRSVPGYDYGNSRQ
jgi:hypothetical protein